jgi:hypothetical protein
LLRYANAAIEGSGQTLTAKAIQKRTHFNFVYSNKDIGMLY